ncbi:hypothetical protein [Paenibacillus residui]|uniref:Uncharacterized protein n=1 Tax=Paenibacillus residui TaxID=629724 RepID=A0ABW3D8J4_9BACL
MPNYTQNLKLHKYDPETDGNTTFDIVDAINNPFDIIDDTLGGQVVPSPPTPISLTAGTQTITVDRDTPFNVLDIRGRTLVNLLGRDGNCEDISRWGKYQVTNELDPDNKTNGSYGLKTIVATGYSTGSSYSVNKNDYQADKHYILIGMLKNGTATDTSLSISGFFNETRSNVVTDSSTFQVAVSKFTGLTMERRPVAVNITGQPGTYSYADEIRLYEITEAEYNAIDSMTPEEVAAKYPYVDSIQNVNAVYVENTGGNLFPQNVKWEQGGLTSTGEELSNPFKIRSPVFTVLPNTQYSLSLLKEAMATLFMYHENGTVSRLLFSKYRIFQSNDDKTRFRLEIGTSDLSTITPSDISEYSPMLTIGSEPVPFQPQRKSYLYLPTCQLASNLDGSVADRMYMDNEGKPRTMRQFRRIELDGDNVQVDYNTRGTDYKRLNVRITDFKSLSFVTVKYDGKILKNVGSEWTGGDEARLWSSDNGHIFSVWNSDSGWGYDYTPTKEDIKAYLLGWRMYNNDVGLTTPYNNTGTKRWFAIANDVEKTPLGSTTPPNYPPNSVVPDKWTPYLLQYQLSSPVDEPLEHEGSLMLYEGANQVEVGTGIVVREKANPVFSGGAAWHINNTDRPLSLLSKRVDKVIKVYCNNEADEWGEQIGSSIGYGNVWLFKNRERYDPAAVYQVTYLALDTYKIGIAPTEISAEYVSNLRGTVDSLVEGNKNALARISVVENQMQMKEPSPPQWITPALLNGWVGYGGGFTRPQYHKDSQGYVHLRGRIKSGTAGLKITLFWLPLGYRPANTSLSYSYQDYSGAHKGEITIDPTGEVAIWTNQNSDGKLDGISFRAEQ